MEQELGKTEASTLSMETARRTESNKEQSSSVETSHLERRVKELQEQLQQVRSKSFT